MDGQEAITLLTEAQTLATSVGGAIFGLLAIVLGFRFARRAFS